MLWDPTEWRLHGHIGNIIHQKWYYHYYSVVFVFVVGFPGRIRLKQGRVGARYPFQDGEREVIGGIVATDTNVLCQSSCLSITEIHTLQFTSKTLNDDEWSWKRRTAARQC